MNCFIGEIEIAFKNIETALLRFVFSNYEMLIIIFNKQKYRFLYRFKYSYY